MATTDLKPDEPGSLPRPGPIGRLVRLAFGLICAWYVQGLLDVSSQLMDSSGHVRPVIWNGIFVGLFLVSYIINIGYSRSWKKWPAIVSGSVFILVAVYGFYSQGMLETAMLAQSIWVWELYIFAHLGLSFLLSALLGTPGCEMRAFHHLWTILTGKETKEHYCPGFLDGIDKRETNRAKEN